jgi:3-dehydroquinate dehydratase II
MKIAIINGPNLNLLGKREPEVYGNQSFQEYFIELQAQNKAIELHYYQSNVEGELVTAIQKFGFEMDAIIINPAAYSHTSLAIADALAAVPCKVAEVHISNIFKREEYRKHSFVSEKAIGVLSGFGLFGYQMAIDYLMHSN